MKCGEDFNLRVNFKIHRQNGINDGAPKYVCDQCNRSFCTRTSLIYHLQSVHLSTGSVKCHEWCLTFEKKDQLNNHTKKIHFQENYKSDCCEKSFAKRKSDETPN
jgi:hypothetical protein